MLAWVLKPFNKPTAQATGSLDYSMGKITFYVTAFSFSQSLRINTSTINNFKMNDSTNNMSGKGNIKIPSWSVNTGFDYYMNDKNNLSFNISHKPISQDVDVTGETILSKNSIPLNTISSLSSNSSHSDETAASLFYKRTFKKPVQEFTAEANIYWFKSNTGSDFTNTTFLYNTDYKSVLIPESRMM
jgi:hypothetical protein